MMLPFLKIGNFYALWPVLTSPREVILSTIRVVIFTIENVPDRVCIDVVTHNLMRETRGRLSSGISFNREQSKRRRQLHPRKAETTISGNFRDSRPAKSLF